jgi:uncharacterized membrane protein
MKSWTEHGSPRSVTLPVESNRFLFSEESMIVLEIIGAIAVLSLIGLGLEWLSKNVSFKRGN